MSTPYDVALDAYVQAKDDELLAETSKQSTANNLTAADLAFNAIQPLPVAGDQEYEDRQKARLQDALAASALADARLDTMKRNREVQQHAQGSKNIVPTPTTPKMGGLVQGQYGKEAWTGGKPLPDWSNLDPQANQIPIATQMRSNNSKAAAALLKRSEGIFNEESLKFKHQDDLNYFLQRIEAHFVKNGMDAIVYRPDPTTTAPGQGPSVMLNLFNDYPKFNKETVNQQNTNRVQRIVR